MSLVPRTVYVVGCDSCGATFHAQGLDEDYELTLPTQQLDPAWAEDMVSRGWIVTSRHLCPPLRAGEGRRLHRAPRT
ncbi:hypothetical protein SANTM175S_02375 [Streptomyces antimycoticus]